MICTECGQREATAVLTSRDRGNMTTKIVCPGCLKAMPSTKSGGVAGYTIDAFDGKALTKEVERCRRARIGHLFDRHNELVARLQKGGNF